MSLPNPPPGFAMFMYCLYLVLGVPRVQPKYDVRPKALLDVSHEVPPSPALALRSPRRMRLTAFAPGGTATSSVARPLRQLGPGSQAAAAAAAAAVTRKCSTQARERPGGCGGGKWWEVRKNIYTAIKTSRFRERTCFRSAHGAALRFADSAKKKKRSIRKNGDTV